LAGDVGKAHIIGAISITVGNSSNKERTYCYWGLITGVPCYFWGAGRIWRRPPEWLRCIRHW